MNPEVVAGGADPGRARENHPTGVNASGCNLDLAYVAELARIDLTAEETALFQIQLAQVLAHATKLQELDLTGVEPAAHAVEALNVFREDEVRPSLPQEEALRDAPRATNDLFVVPKVLE